MTRFLAMMLVLSTLLGLSSVSATAQDVADLYCLGYAAIEHPYECDLPPELDGKDLQMDFVTFPIYGEFAFSQTSNAVIYTLTSTSFPQGSTDAFSVILTDLDSLEEWEVHVDALPTAITPDQTFSFDFPTQSPSGGLPPSSLIQQIVILEPGPEHTLRFYPDSAPTLGTVSIVDDTGSTLGFERKFTFTYTPHSTDRDVGAWDSFRVRADAYIFDFVSYVTVNIYLPPTPELIVVSDQAFSGAAGAPLSGNLTANGGEGPLEFVVGVQPAYGNVVISADGSFTYTPYTNEAIDDDFLASVTDGVTSREFMVTITLANPPLNEIVDPDQQFTGDPRFPIEGSVAQISGTAEITYSLGSSPGFGSVVLDPDGHFTYIASDITQPGDSFTVVATGGSGESVTIAVALVFDVDETVPTKGTVGPGKSGSNGGGNGSEPSDPRSPVAAPVKTPTPDTEEDADSDSCGRCN